MKVNGYYLAIGFLGLIEYYYYLIVRDIYYPINMYLAGLITIVFLGLAFNNSNKIEKTSQLEEKE